MLSVDGTFLIMFASFLVFMLLMNSLFFVPIGQVKKHREATVLDGHQEAQQALNQSAMLSDDYQQKLTEARQKAQQMVQEKREQAKAEAAAKVSASREQALLTLEQQASRLNQAREAVYQDLKPHRETMVQTIVEKLKGLQLELTQRMP